MVAVERIITQACIYSRFINLIIRITGAAFWRENRVLRVVETTNCEPKNQSAKTMATTDNLFVLRGLI
jgi:hypothetical protein